MNTTICDALPWYKIGKLLLHTQKEKHSNGLEDRPSFCQVDKEALCKNHKTVLRSAKENLQKHKSIILR